MKTFFQLSTIVILSPALFILWLVRKVEYCPFCTSHYIAEVGPSPRFRILPRWLCLGCGAVHFFDSGSFKWERIKELEREEKKP